MEGKNFGEPAAALLSQNYTKTTYDNLIIDLQVKVKIVSLRISYLAVIANITLQGKYILHSFCNSRLISFDGCHFSLGSWDLCMLSRNASLLRRISCGSSVCGEAAAPRPPPRV